MAVGTLRLHRFNGDEIFAVTSATLTFFEESDESEGFAAFDITTDKTPLKTLPDTEDLFAHPNAEWNLILSDFDTAKIVGQTFSIPFGDDDGEWLARLYYCEHQAIDNNIIEVMAFDGNSLDVKITGTTMDVNVYDGSVPPTTVVMEAKFIVKE